MTEFDPTATDGAPDGPAATLTAERLTAVMRRFHGALGTYAPALNRLNVYPVPDGDTGTNMRLTAGSVVDALDEAAVDGSVAMDSVAAAIAHGSLMGARGNSGIILSQILRGLTDTFRDRATVGCAEFIAALGSAADAAYDAVVAPVEGTILTVVRAAADGARDVAASLGDDLGALAQEVYDRARAALASTPDLLPVLKDAGVVDAGGAGLILLLASFVEETTGVQVPLPASILDAAAAAEEAPGESVAGTLSATALPDVAELRYEVMFFLDASDDRLASFREAWAELGDSIAVVGGDGTYNCHIHTDHIGPAIEAGIAVGKPWDIRITDLLEQAADVAHHGAESAATAREAPAPDPTTVTVAEGIGVVAVAAGDGVAAMLRDLGVHAVVTGGQSMNPSTEELLAAVDAIGADEVVILPNNKNIIPVAERVDSLAAAHVAVVPTKAVVQGIAAMLAFDSGATLADVAVAMGEETAAIRWCEVTQAIRDSATPAGQVVAGQWLGLCEGVIASVSDTAEDALVAVVAASVDATSELITVILGEDATRDMTEKAAAYLAANHPSAELQVVDGGQPLYPFLVSVE